MKEYKCICGRKLFWYEFIGEKLSLELPPCKACGAVNTVSFERFAPEVTLTISNSTITIGQ